MPRRPPSPPTGNRTSRRSIRRGALIVLVAAAAMGAAAAWWFASRPPDTALARLVEQCELEMVRGTCRVQSNDGGATPIDTLVFVAGVGRIDAAAYRRLREAGKALCSSVRESCGRDWDGADCRAARALHGQR